MKYILYCRKSTDTEDKQVMSLESQEKELLDLAAQHGLEVSKIMRESQSAKAEGRPIFGSVLASIRAGEADAILCWKLDRLARNMADGGRVIDLLQRGVIKQIRTHDAVHSPADNVLMLAVQLGMANQYIRDLSENVKRGNRTKLERGGWPNKAPFGYINNPATKELEFDLPRSKAVVRIYELYVSGRYSLNEVQRIIATEGFRTESGTEIMKSTIDRILLNRFYIGIMFVNDIAYVGKHEPLISKAMFDQAWRVRMQQLRPKTQKLLFPYRGILRCASCSCMYTATLKKGHDYYYCTNGKKKCEAHTKYLRSEPATKLIADALEKIIFDQELIEIMYEAARERQAEKFSYAETIKKRFEGELAALERRELAAFEDSLSGLLRRDLYEKMMNEIKVERVLIQKDLNDIEAGKHFVSPEPIKKIFDLASTARSRFLDAEPEDKQLIASQILSNLFVKDGIIEEIQYKSPYQVLAKASKTPSSENLLADWDSNFRISNR